MVKEYNPESVRAYMSICWDSTPDPRATLDLVEKFRNENPDCEIFYLQNSTDRHHVERHMMPLLNVLEVGSKVQLLVDDWGKGHKPPPKQLLRTILEGIVNSQGSFEYSKLGFNQVEGAPGLGLTLPGNRRGSLSLFLKESGFPRQVVHEENVKLPSREKYLELFDKAAGPKWSLSTAGPDEFTVSMPSGECIKVDPQALGDSSFWERKFASQDSTNRLWLRSCWFSAEIARAGNVSLSIKVLESYHRWLISKDLDPRQLAMNSLDHCLALNFRTCAWLMMAVDLSDTQKEQVRALVKDLYEVTVGYDRFLGNNHGIMLALSIFHAASASGYLPPSTHNLSRLTTFLYAVFNQAVSPGGLVRENTSIYQFLWAKWAWEIANTFEYVLGEREKALDFVEKARRITATSELFGIDSVSTLPLGDGCRRSAPVYGPRRGVMDGADDGLVIINDGEGQVFAYTAGSPTAVHRHADEHAIRLYFQGAELIADAGFNSYDVNDPVSRCVTSQRGHSGLYFPQFDGLPGSTFYPSNDPRRRSHGTLRLIEASPHSAELVSHRVVDSHFTTQRMVQFDGEARHLKIADFAHAARGLAEASPVARFLIPGQFERLQGDSLKFASGELYVELIPGPLSCFTVDRGEVKETSEADELRGIICLRPGQPESAWVVEVELREVGDSCWQNNIDVFYGIRDV